MLGREAGWGGTMLLFSDEEKDKAERSFFATLACGGLISLTMGTIRRQTAEQVIKVAHGGSGGLTSPHTFISQTN